MYQKISSIMLIGFILIAFSWSARAADEYPNKPIHRS